jgi:hypothetical protein
MADIDFIQFRYGPPTKRAVYVLDVGEPGWDGDALYVGDGVTPGGLPAAGAGGGLTQSVADGRYATLAQGAKADSALQPGGLATVATTGAYSDLSGKPAIPAA